MTGAYHAIPPAQGTIANRPVGSFDHAGSSRQGQREFVVSRGDFQIRLASTDKGQRSHVSMLIQRMYAWRGLLTKAPTQLDTHANQVTLIASRGATVFGTVSLGLDSGEKLAADTLYGEELDQLRQQNARICEMTRLAIDPAFNSKEVLGSIFHLAYIFSRLIHGMTDLVIEVNPRHAPFYRKMLGFTVIGPERTCPRVNAPAVLLHLPLSYADDQISRHGGGIQDNGRTLYSQFLSEHEQAGLLRRIQSDPQLSGTH